MLQHLPHPLGGTVPQVVSPIRFLDEPLRFDRAPPWLGQDTDDVLREIGLDDAARAALAEEGLT
jgi:crotonobetainyl-CoA:carnitine CoA-transferase CaiB-like acyl-CoA transferase